MQDHPARWRRALVTGGSAGLGATFAQRLASRGFDLVLVARREAVLTSLAEQLQSNHGTRVEVLSADLATDEGVDAVAARLRDDGDPVDLLVNNAGITTMGALHRLDADRERTLVRLNAEAVLLLAHAHLSALAQRRSPGGLVNVASMSAFQPFPIMASYGATKAFVVALSENLAASYGRHGVRVQALCPGFVDTGMAEANDIGEAATRIPGPLLLDPEQVVDASLRGLARDRVVVVPGLQYRLLHGMTSLLPRPLLRRLMTKALT